VVHNAAEERFELRIGGERCLLNYRRSAGKLVIYHTEVPQPFEGRGLAERMTRAALDFARFENLQVEPRCSYAAYFMQKHPEYDDLLAAR
jgi:predicted GNAT family acetyltransferase